MIPFFQPGCSRVGSKRLVTKEAPFTWDSGSRGLVNAAVNAWARERTFVVESPAGKGSLASQRLAHPPHWFHERRILRGCRAKHFPDGFAIQVVERVQPEWNGAAATVAVRFWPQDAFLFSVSANVP